MLETDDVPEGKNAEVVRTQEALERLTPSQFEALAACLLEAEGKDTFVTPQTSDAGIDVVGISGAEVWCVQVKHAERRRNRVDKDAANEAQLGATHYRDDIVPKSLSKRTWKTAVLTNGKISRHLRTDAERAGVELIEGAALLRRVQRAGINLSDVFRADAARAGSTRGAQGGSRGALFVRGCALVIS